MAEPVVQVQDEDRDFEVVIRDGDGNPETGYTAANPLSATIWRGDAQAALAAPVVTWDDPAAATCIVRVTRADLAGLEPGLYHLQAFVDEPDGGHECFLDAELRVLASAGSGTPPKAYCTADELAVYFPRIVELQADTDQTGFAEQLARARQWVDRVILRRRVADPATGRVGDVAPLRALLDADGLVVTPEVSEMAAYRALAIILAGEVADTAIVAAGRESGYQQAGAKFQARADAMADRFIAEIDTNGDGVADLSVDCRPPEVVEALRPRVLETGRLRVGARSRPDCREI